MQAIQAAIDAAAASLHAGDSEEDDESQAYAVLSLGIFLSGTVYLKPRVVLFVDDTAILKASTNSTLFQRDTDWPYQAALVAGYSADFSGVMGGGAIDGQAPQFVTALDPLTDQYTFRTYHSAAAGSFRVRLIDFKHSRGVSVVGVSLVDATSFHLHFLNCSQVLAESVTVSSDLRWPNCDGIDVTSCNNTVIRGCTIRTGDDAFSPKTWQSYGPTINLLIEDSQSISNSYITSLFFKMAQNLDLRCVLVPAPWVLGPKHVSNPE